MMNKIKNISSIIGLVLIGFSLNAQLSLPNVFSDHMVLQRNQNNPIWGKAKPGEKIKITIAGQSHNTIADNNGDWKVKLDPMKEGGPYQLSVQGKNTIILEDILVGEVWVCGGQSNMGFALGAINNNEVEIASANYPEIRLLRVPTKGDTIPQYNIDAKWTVCTPKTVQGFSGIGYLYGRTLHNTLGVPVGLINVGWGSASLETWIPRDVLEATNEYYELLEDWDAAVSEFSDEKLAEANKEFEAWQAAGKPGKKMFPPQDIRIAQKRPANAFNAMIHPIIGYGIKGGIWYQGETNVGRSYQHRDMFPLFINTWRQLWGQGDFPFYWSQLADFNDEDEEPSNSMWAEFRESQTMSLSLPNTGEAVIFDTGEGRDIHPKNKQTVAGRLVRLPLAKDYGYDLESESPRYASMEITGNVATITFDNVDQGLYAFDVETVKGFAIAGNDKKFVWAEAKIVGKNKVEVYSDKVLEPVAVRYGWANNPVINLYDRNGLPVTGFRTDSWPGVTVDKKKAQRNY